MEDGPTVSVYSSIRPTPARAGVLAGSPPPLVAEGRQLLEDRPLVAERGREPRRNDGPTVAEGGDVEPQNGPLVAEGREGLQDIRRLAREGEGARGGVPRLAPRRRRGRGGGGGGGRGRGAPGAG